MTASHDEPEGDQVDAWEAARERQRQQVQAIFAAHEPAAPVERRRDFRPSLRGWALTAALLAAVAAVLALTVPRQRDSAADQRRAERATQAALEARERARLRSDVKPRFAPGPRRRAGEPPLAYRTRLVAAGEATITTDARARFKDGTVRGSVAGTRCTPFPIGPTRSAQERDPAVPRGRYDCIAYNRSFDITLQGKPRTGLIGIPYWLVADYETGRLTFCRVTPRPAEGGKSLVDVVVPAPCRDPLRRR